jgi:alkylated DNA repair dioxygenase AlkB
VDRARQPSLFEPLGPIGPASLELGIEREDLGREAWLELRRGWMVSGDDLFDRLLAEVPWREEKRVMYDRMVAVPRLVAPYGEDEDLPDDSLTEALGALNDHYGHCPGGPFRTVGLCLYRDGRDSVAWHGDRIGRRRDVDTLVGILSLGASRRLLLRPRGGGPSRRFELGCGDLLVMGGSCQRTWEHSVPKTTRPCGLRISVQFRSPGAGGDDGAGADARASRPSRRSTSGGR